MTKSTPWPLPTPLAMTTAPNDSAETFLPARTSSLAPPPKAAPSAGVAQDREDVEESSDKSAQEASRPHPRPEFPSAKYRFECHDLTHAGSSVFFQNADPTSCLSKAVATVLSTLYQPTNSNSHIPPTRSITLVLRSMDGLADTGGLEIDNDHKQMNFSLDYIKSIDPSIPGRQALEIAGVILHEMVHAWQWDGKGTAPGGLTEGIADFVRLKAGLGPPHWTKKPGNKWDAGYQVTAYFLDWLETTQGEGSVRKINATLKDEEYDESSFWRRLFGSDVEDLWERYQTSLKESDDKTAESKPTMADDDFWKMVREIKGKAEAIPLKACWRTRRHVKEDTDYSKDDLVIELRRLWLMYLEKLGKRTDPDGEPLDGETTLNAKDDGV